MKIIKYGALATFAAAFCFSFIGQPSHGWVPSYKDYRFFIDNHPISLLISGLSLLIIVFSVWYERRKLR